MFRLHSLRAIVLSALFATTCLSAASAQQRFSAGPRVGLNLSKFGKDVVDNKFHPGFTAGAFLMYSSLNHFGISVDALYSQRGAAFRNPDGSSLNYNQRVNYLEIPVALRYFLTLNGNFRPNVFFGPSLAFKLNAKNNLVPAPNNDNSAAFNSADLGLLAGFQLNWPGFGERQRFLIDARYTYGLTDVTAQPIPGGINGQNINNSMITLTLGYGFGVGPEYRSRYRR
ncbi:porin family protein [Spirosoma lacussanchae]|uniref:porin family protein n=1 Tax=Spirosoma lacussanchae TaxID=1884249 RepID=UPI001107C944|nr:porin family protein [Spirosoma lacussanchae]